MASAIETNSAPSNNVNTGNTATQIENPNTTQNIQMNQGNQGYPVQQQYPMQFAPHVNTSMNQQVLHNPIPHGYSQISQQMPVQMQSTIPTQIPNINQNIQLISAPNQNLSGNPGYIIPQNFGTMQVQNLIQNNHPQQQVPIQPFMQQQQTPNQSYYSQLAMQSNMPQIPAQPYDVNNIPQNPNQINIYNPEQKVIDRKNLFTRYITLCKYDSANMVKKYHYFDTFVSSAHLIGLASIFFSRKYDQMVFGGGKNYMIGAFVFLFANFYLYSFYNTYFLRRSFEIKYRDVDDENLENIIKSLEAYRVRAHH